MLCYLKLSHKLPLSYRIGASFQGDRCIGYHSQTLTAKERKLEEKQRLFF